MLKTKIKKLLPRKINKIVKGAPQRLFFIHIPKTAGSSFRASFENKSITFKDYGNGSNSTTDQVQESIYDNNDFYALKKQFYLHQKVWITGHVHLVKYVDFVPTSHTVSFVREPLSQVLSHYNHYVKYHDFKDDLNTFLDKPFAKNLQSKFLNFMPLGLIGCVGLTEKYDESLSFINGQFSLELPVKKINVNKDKKFTDDLLDATLHEKFMRNNQLDIEMYEEAEFLHMQRVAINEQSWTYGYANINQHNLLHGCAFRYQNDKSVLLIVKLNKKPLKTIEAKNFYGAFAKANFPRDRYIGFNFSLPTHIKSDDDIDIYVQETGQKLNYKPLKVMNK